MIKGTTFTSLFLCAGLCLPAMLCAMTPAQAEKLGSTTHVLKDGRKKGLDLDFLDRLPKKKKAPKLDLSGTNYDLKLDGIPPCGGRALLKCP